MVAEKPVEICNRRQLVNAKEDDKSLETTLTELMLTKGNVSIEDKMAAGSLR